MWNESFFSAPQLKRDPLGRDNSSIERQSKTYTSGRRSIPLPCADLAGREGRNRAVARVFVSRSEGPKHRTVRVWDSLIASSRVGGSERPICASGSDSLACGAHDRGRIGASSLGRCGFGGGTGCRDRCVCGGASRPVGAEHRYSRPNKRLKLPARVD